MKIALLGWHNNLQAWIKYLSGCGFELLVLDSSGRAKELDSDSIKVFTNDFAVPDDVDAIFDFSGNYLPDISPSLPPDTILYLVAPMNKGGVLNVYKKLVPYGLNHNLVYFPQIDENMMSEMNPSKHLIFGVHPTLFSANKYYLDKIKGLNVNLFLPLLTSNNLMLTDILYTDYDHAEDYGNSKTLKDFLWLTINREEKSVDI